MLIDRIDTVLKTTPGLSETGETCIIGGDHPRRDNFRFAKESMILTQSLRTAAIDQALGGGLVERTDQWERSA